jgi:hypothetical protein
MTWWPLYDLKLNSSNWRSLPMAVAVRLSGADVGWRVL